MKLTSLLSVALLALGASASPTAEGIDARAPPNVGTKLHPHFNLRTKVKEGQASGKDRFDGKLVDIFHINADWQELVVYEKRSIPFALNGTHLQTMLDNPYPFGVQLVSSVYNTYWQAVEIHAGYGVGKFHFEGDELRAGAMWGGWRVCEWWHNVPQLFWVNAEWSELEPAKLTSNCAEVKLIKEPVHQ